MDCRVAGNFDDCGNGRLFRCRNQQFFPKGKGIFCCESSVAEESSETEENQSENSSEAEKNADTANQSKVLFEDSTARITYTGTDEESWMGKG